MNDVLVGRAVNHSATEVRGQESETQLTIALRRLQESQLCPVDPEAPVARFESAL